MSNMQENCINEQKTWEIVQAARSVGRPRASTFVHSFEDFDELRGDRVFGTVKQLLAARLCFWTRLF